MRPRLVVTLASVVLLAAPAWADAPAGPPAKTASRAGLPYKPDSDQAGPKDLVDAIRARRAGGKLLNLDRMLLNSPAFARGWNTMFGAIRGQLAVPARLRELCIMTIGTLNQADYEWAQHEKEFLAAGGNKDQLAALKNVAAALKNTQLFDEPERATLALTDEMTRSIKVSAATMRRIRKVLPDDQVVELIGTIAGYNMVSRFVVATGVELE
ncbi:MAG TPA: carboxymuconolactone decarboxylase family protein [Kofleriaceae bacterium]|jgi:alkylhydroperoxidase family enzyme|nr:carboxymuconolactone decarboxylase family protein [Kofleriaceae bacterium]